jgi:peptide/nickel transport system permease protein
MWIPKGRRTGRRLSALLGGGLLRLAFVLFLGFLLFHVVPGDPATSLTRGRPSTPAEVAATRHELGLDRPLVVQFGRYVTATARGNLGVSFEYHRPVAALIAQRLWPTVLLVGTATVLSVAIGLSTGGRAGWRPHGCFDRVSTSTALALWATPTFWLALLLLIGLGVGVGPLPGLFPVGGMRAVSPPRGLFPAAGDVLSHLALPCLTLVAVQVAQYHLVLRSSMLGERGRGYVLLAHGKGLRDVAVRQRHVLPNAVVPAMTLALMNLGFVLSGAVAVETVFSWPGLGSLSFEALQIPDLPLLNGTFLLLSATVIVANTAADLLAAALDPRLAAARP